MINMAVEWLLGKIPAEFLLAAIGVLFVANLATGVMLKGAWQDIATERANCKTEKLEYTLQQERLVNSRITELRDERDRAILARIDADENAKQRIEARLDQMAQRHSDELRRYQDDLASISDEDYLCATERAADSLVTGMRDRARAFNSARAETDRSRNPDLHRDTEEPITILPAN